MAKITETRIFEISKIIATKAGKECQDGWSYVSSIAELTLRNLRNGLTFADNLDCEVKRISLKHSNETEISITSKKRPSRIYIDRIVSDNFYKYSSFGWRFGPTGAVVLALDFTPLTASGLSASASGTTITVTKPSHGLITGDLVSIYKAAGFTNSPAVNGVNFAITALSVNTFSFEVATAPAGGPGTVSVSAPPSSSLAIDVDITIFFG